jgi:glycerol-3-phosphate dehydrogenase (NAD(P)+)
MKFGYFGAGTWGFSLASLLASKGYEVVLWGQNTEQVKVMQKTGAHPKFPDYPADANLTFTTDFARALAGADVIVESVTTKGIRPVFQRIVDMGGTKSPIVITSKGIEQNSCLLLPEIVVDVMGPSARSQVGCISGPSHAEEVIQKLPTSIVASAYDPAVMLKIHDLFSTPYFRIYPNADINGVSFGGAMKNPIAIACGIADGLGLGDNTKAALMTRGLHEMRKLSVVKEAKPETLNGLSGLGDLCVTCLSSHSRNSKFGRLIGKGYSLEEAQKEVGMVVEGAYTCLSAMQLAKKANIEIPITEAVYSILYGRMNPRDAVKQLLQRAIKEEHL